MSDTGLKEWRCSVCGEVHETLPAVVISAPAMWFNADESQRADEFELTSDTCVWKGEHFFVRCVLPLPFTDRDGSLDFGVWSTLSPANFSRYMALSDSAERGALGPMFGWFANSLPGYPETMTLKCKVHPNEPDIRPTIELEPTGHPLSVQQRDGLKFADAVAYCHEHLGL